MRLPPYAASLLLVAAIFAGAVAQDKPDEKKPEQKKAEKKEKAPKLEDCLRRATAKVRSLSEDGLHFTRLTVLPEPPSTNDANDRLTAVAEFDTGAVAIFQGSVDSDEDAFVVIDRQNVQALYETCMRQRPLSSNR